MPLIQNEDSDAQKMVDGWAEEACRRILAQRGKGMDGKKEYVITEQVFNGHRTLDRGETVFLTDAQAEQLRDYVKPSGEPVSQPAQPENRMVSGGGKPGRSK